MSSRSEVPDFTYSVHTKPSRSGKKGSSSNVVTSTSPKKDTSSFIMSVAPIVISIGTVALVYFLYRDIKNNKAENYKLSQTVKDCHAKIVELQASTDQSSDLTEILRAASGQVIFDNSGNSKAEVDEAVEVDEATEVDEAAETVYGNDDDDDIVIMPAVD